MYVCLFVVCPSSWVWSGSSCILHLDPRYSLCLSYTRLLCQTSQFQDIFQKSIECITHAGHWIAFNMFLHFVACDLDLWPWPFDLIFIGGRGLVMDYPCGKFGDCSFIRFWVIAQTDKQTHTQTRMNALLTRLSSAWAANYPKHYRQHLYTMLNASRLTSCWALWSIRRRSGTIILTLLWPRQLRDFGSWRNWSGRAYP